MTGILLVWVDPEEAAKEVATAAGYILEERWCPIPIGSPDRPGFCLRFSGGENRQHDERIKEYPDSEQEACDAGNA